MADLPSPGFDRARALVLRYGWNATAYQILNPGIRHWFWAEGDAVFGYVRSWRMWVAAGAPVCAPDGLGAASAAFEAEAAAHGASVCYSGADARLRAEHPGFSEMLLGAQPVWDPSHWPAIIENKASLRAQRNRAHGRRFYNFEGFEPFKTKFCPDRWDPITALSNERGPTPLTFLAIADAFSGEGVSPVRFVGAALVDALWQEVRTLWGLRDGAARPISSG